MDGGNVVVSRMDGGNESDSWMGGNVVDSRMDGGPALTR